MQNNAFYINQISPYYYEQECNCHQDWFKKNYSLAFLVLYVTLEISNKSISIKKENFMLYSCGQHNKFHSEMTFCYVKENSKDKFASSMDQ